MTSKNIFFRNGPGGIEKGLKKMPSFRKRLENRRSVVERHTDPTRPDPTRPEKRRFSRTTLGYKIYNVSGFDPYTNCRTVNENAYCFEIAPKQTSTRRLEIRRDGRWCITKNNYHQKPEYTHTHTNTHTHSVCRA